MNQFALIIADRVPALIATASAEAQTRFLEFFAANVRNRHTRRAHAGDMWVSEGDYAALTLATRLARTEAVVMIQRSRWLCLFRVNQLTSPPQLPRQLPALIAAADDREF